MYTSFIWDLDDDPDGNVAHIAEHDLTPDDVESAMEYPVGHGFSRTSGRPVIFGYSVDGRFICVVYEEVDDSTVRPVTAFEADELEFDPNE